MKIFPINQSSRSRINAFLVHHWFTTDMVVHGECIDLGKSDGLYALEHEEITGLVTYRIRQNEMEILSLDSVYENRGIGTALLNAAIQTAMNRQCSRIMLITTNDNIKALSFYQKRGFDMVRLYRNAVEQARAIKPEIPLTGENGIPVKHEIELEMII